MRRMKRRKRLISKRRSLKCMIWKGSHLFDRYHLRTFYLTPWHTYEESSMGEDNRRQRTHFAPLATIGVQVFEIFHGSGGSDLILSLYVVPFLWTLPYGNRLTATAGERGLCKDAKRQRMHFAPL